MSEETTVHDADKPWYSIDMELLKPKLAYFFYLGSLGSITPIASLWMRSRGLSKVQTGALTSTRPFISFVALPLAGLIADKFKIHKLLLVSLCVLAIIFRLIMISGSWLAWISAFFMMSELLGTPVSSLLDAGVIELLGPERRDLYGKQRVWGSLAFGLVAFLIGLVVSHAGGNFNIYYLNYAAMSAVGALIFFTMSVTSVKTPAPLWESLGIVFSSVHVFVFFLLITMIGAAQGVIGTFLFILLDELHASKVTMGLATAVACAAEMPFLFFSKPLLRVLGERNMLYLACIGGMFRVTWYTIIGNPWYVLIAETMHGPFFGALWTASMSYVHTIAPPGLGATAQGLMGGLYGGLGMGFGSLIGGAVYQRWGYITLFRGTAVWLFFALIMFFGTNAFFKPIKLEDIGHAAAAAAAEHPMPALDDLETQRHNDKMMVQLDNLEMSSDESTSTNTSSTLLSSPSPSSSSTETL